MASQLANGFQSEHMELDDGKVSDKSQLAWCT